MQKSVALLQVFAILRKELGTEVPDKEVLRFAGVVVEFFVEAIAVAEYREEFGWNTSAGVVTSARPFEEWPVDRAMEDGGWRVLEYEYGRVRDEHLDYGYLIRDEGLIARRFPEGTLEGDEVLPEPMGWLSFDKTHGQVAAAIGWAVDRPNLHFYANIFDEDT